MSITRQTSSRAADADAAAWLARLSSPDCSNEERAAFEDWLAQSPEHIDAYLDVEAIHATARELADDDLLRAAARRARRETRTGAATARRLRKVMAGAAIAASLLLAIGLIRRQPPPRVPPTRLATEVGEQRSIALADGTSVRLDTDSQVSVQFDRERRLVVVDRGRVQFQVGADPKRPFVVKAGAGTVRDIGTTFQVSRVGGEVRVGLIEGAVMVSVDGGAAARGTLAPGEQVRIDARGVLHPRQPFDLVVAQSWPHGDLVFKERRLDELLAEMNRYSQTQLRLDDAELGSLRVNGVFHIGDQAALVAALEKGWNLRVQRVGTQEIVLSKSSRRR